MDSSGKSLLPFDDDSSADLVEGPPSSGRLRAFAEPAQIEEARARSGRYASISPAATRAFLGKTETQSLIRSVVRARLARDTPSDVVDDIVQAANLRMLSTPSGPRALTTARGWACAVTRSEIVRYFRRKKAEARWLVDDADIEDHPDLGPEPSGDLLIGPWLAKAVHGAETDEETLEILLKKAAGDRTFESVAEEFGMRPGALRKRVFDFKTKYEPRYRRRQEMFVLLILFGAAAIAIALWYLLRPVTPVILPDPTAPVFHQAPKVEPTDTPFEPAQPAPAPQPTSLAPPVPAPRPPQPPQPPRTPQRTPQNFDSKQ
jgi:DNA-directed RNA polymerase specialized sigma24 family protein